MIDGEGAIKNSGLFHNISRSTTSHTYQRNGTMISTFREMLDKIIKPGQQWTDLIYPILLTYSNKLAHSSTDFTPKEARTHENELMV